MRRLIFASAALAALSVVGAALAASAGDGNRDHGVTVLRFVEQIGATGQTYVPAGATSPVGDRITWSAGIFDRHGHQVGKDTADCTIVATTGIVQCLFSIDLPGGELTAQGIGEGSTDTTFAITGGMGAYRAARGEVRAVDTTVGQRAELTITLVDD
jgi:allene oxide cyclase